MSDITKCKGEGCPLKESCYRYTSDISMLQSYFITLPYKDQECDMYWSESSQQVFNLLKKITNGKDNNGI
jgi:hypothetical protein